MCFCCLSLLYSLLTGYDFVFSHLGESSWHPHSHFFFKKRHLITHHRYTSAPPVHLQAASPSTPPVLTLLPSLETLRFWPPKHRNLRKRNIERERESK
ncbi:hypothetical protein HanRHA438_Chr15g0702571 [Helianthus annuus]|nr:hypothetical protein HanRHA438_Chr15g0702571 [Helianthus annuus]